MSRFEFSLAETGDDTELRARMAEVFMPGNITLSFRREPSYFAGSRLQGETVQVVKCVDRQRRQIVGLGCRALSRAWINGKPQRVGYLADLRGRAAYRGGTLLARGYDYLHHLHRQQPVELYYTMILDDNQAARRLLESGRCGLPRYRDCGRFLTPAIFLDLPRRALCPTGIEFARAEPDRLEDILAFVSHWQSRKQLAPVYTLADFETGRLQGLKAQDIYLALRDGKIVAVCAAWDQREFRQTHVERYSTLLRLLRPAYNVLAGFSPLQPLPPEGAMLQHFYLALVAVEDNDRELFAALLRYLYLDRRRSGWHYFIAGLHERDPLAQVLADYRRIKTAGRLYIVHYDEDAAAYERLDDRVPFVEIGAI